jgi:hypothetical protein
VLALLGVNSLAELGPQYLLFSDTPIRAPKRASGAVQPVTELRAVSE